MPYTTFLRYTYLNPHSTKDNFSNNHSHHQSQDVFSFNQMSHKTNQRQCIQICYHRLNDIHSFVCTPISVSAFILCTCVCVHLHEECFNPTRDFYGLSRYSISLCQCICTGDCIWCVSLTFKSCMLHSLDCESQHGVQRGLMCECAFVRGRGVGVCLSLPS